MTRRTGLAKELRRIRIEQGLRRADLAELAGVDVRTIDSIESNGNVGKVGTLEALAAALHTDLGPLLEMRRTAIRNRSRAVRRKLAPVLLAPPFLVAWAARTLAEPLGLEHAVCWGCWVFGFDIDAAAGFDADGAIVGFAGLALGCWAVRRLWRLWDVRLEREELRRVFVRSFVTPEDWR